MSGIALSHYRITEMLGTGARGEVYRVEDTNPPRHFAIELPPSEFAHEIDRLNRFESDMRLRLGKESPRR